MDSASDISFSERVRRSTAWSALRSTSVAYDERGAEAFAECLPLQEIQAAYRWDHEYHLSGSAERMIDYVFTLDAINFGSGYSPEWKAKRSGTTYTAAAQALKHLAESGVRLGPSFAAEVTPQDLARMFGVAPEFPLMQRYAHALNELGQWAKGEFGSYAQLLRSLPEGSRAETLIQILVAHASCFDDRAEYMGAQIHFYKRAQILVDDLHLALAPESPFLAHEIDALTSFADNLVPHVLRKEGVLRYPVELIERIARKEELISGETAEVEIRACAVFAVERLVDLMRKREKTRRINAAMLDRYLWCLGQAPRYKSEPRHLCKTYFY